MTKEEKEMQLPSVEFLKEDMAIGEIFAKSGMFPDIKSQAQAVVKILAGKELGLSPFEAMKNLYLVNGKLAIQSNAMASLVRRSKIYDYKVVKINNEECVITFFRIGNEKVEELGTSTFTFKDAARAGLANKDVWKNYPQNMLFARALANGVRFYCPDAVCGWHTVEEMEEVYSVSDKKTITLSENGDVKEVEVVSG